MFIWLVQNISVGNISCAMHKHLNCQYSIAFAKYNCWKSTRKTLEQCSWINITFNFRQVISGIWCNRNRTNSVNNVVLVYLFLILKRFHTFFRCFYCWFWASKCRRVLSSEHLFSRKPSCNSCTVLSCGKYRKDFLLFQEDNLFDYVDVNYTC